MRRRGCRGRKMDQYNKEIIDRYIWDVRYWCGYKQPYTRAEMKKWFKRFPHSPKGAAVQILKTRRKNGLPLHPCLLISLANDDPKGRLALEINTTTN